MWSAASAITFQTAIYTRLTLQQCKSCASTETTEVWRPWPAGWGNGGGLRQLFPVNATDVTPCNTSRLTYIPLQLLISPAKRWTSFTRTFYTSTSFVHEWYYRGGGRKVLFALTFMNGIISVRFLLDLDLETSESVSDCVNEWNQKQQKSSN